MEFTFLSLLNKAAIVTEFLVGRCYYLSFCLLPNRSILHTYISILSNYSPPESLRVLIAAAFLFHEYIKKRSVQYDVHIKKRPDKKNEKYMKTNCVRFKCQCEDIIYESIPKTLNFVFVIASSGN